MTSTMGIIETTLADGFRRVLGVLGRRRDMNRAAGFTLDAITANAVAVLPVASSHLLVADFPHFDTGVI